MRNLFQLNHNKDKKAEKDILLFLAQRSFWLILLLFFVSLVVGGIIYYRYLVLLQSQGANLAPKSMRFKESQFQELLKEQQNREIRLNAVDTQQYRDLFRL